MKSSLGAKSSEVNLNMRILNKFALIILFGMSGLTFSQSKLDTALVNVRGVYFFGPSPTELDSIDENYNEAYADFSYYTNKVVPFIKSIGIAPKYLSAREIRIEQETEPIIIDRDTLEFGTILLNDNNPPLILKYVFTDSELKEKINQYFKEE